MVVQVLDVKTKRSQGVIRSRKGLFGDAEGGSSDSDDGDGDGGVSAGAGAFASARGAVGKQQQQQLRQMGASGSSTTDKREASAGTNCTRASHSRKSSGSSAVKDIFGAGDGDEDADGMSLSLSTNLETTELVAKAIGGKREKTTAERAYVNTTWEILASFRQRIFGLGSANRDVLVHVRRRVSMSCLRAVLNGCVHLTTAWGENHSLMHLGVEKLVRAKLCATVPLGKWRVLIGLSTLPWLQFVSHG